jgi:hypothetical protein
MTSPRALPAAALALLAFTAVAGCTCKATAPGPGDPGVLELSVSQAMSGTWIKYRIDLAPDGGAVGRSTEPAYGPSDPAEVPGTPLKPEARQYLLTTLVDSNWASLKDTHQQAFDGTQYEVKIAWGHQKNAFKVGSGCACAKPPCPCPQLAIIGAIRTAVDPTLPDGGPMPMQDPYGP